MRWVALDEAHRQALLAAATDLPPAAPSSGGTATQQRQQRLHEMLSSIRQIVQDMGGLASRRQQLPLVIDPAMLSASVSTVYYGGMTIDGPHVTQAGQRCFYLEQQHGQACAQHAVNAMVGGPLVSLTDFARYETTAQASWETVHISMEGSAARMLLEGVHVETVQGALHAAGMPTHCYAHRPIDNASGLPGLDPAQARFLDTLPTDRLLLQADRYEGDGTSSHYVAFRREGGQWTLLDSGHHLPQQGVAPSAYLLGDEKIRHFTALWPQHALQGKGASAADDDRARQALQTDMLQSAKQSAGQRRELPAGGIPYPANDACNHWKNSTRAQEFAPLRDAWNAATGKSASGAAFLRHLSAQCDEALAAGQGEPVDEAGSIIEFEVKTHPQGEAMRVWRGVEGSGGINLRLAPAPSDDRARQALLTDMLQSARKSASQRREKPAGGIPYPASKAKHHWKGPRAQEFAPLLAAWNAATGKSASGAAFLRHLSAQCDEALAAGRGEPVDEAGSIIEFEVKTHPQGEAMRVWRGVEASGGISLRLAPAPGDERARQALQTNMLQSAKQSAGRRREKPAGGIPYSASDAYNHWKGPRAQEFAPLLAAWNAATGKSASGAAFLRHLSAQCDEALAAGRGEPVDEAGLIGEFEVKTHPQGEAMRVWRGVEASGGINLRLAPAPGDDEARQALLTDMLQSAKQSAGRRREKPAGGIPYSASDAYNHWKGQRAQEFAPLLDAWNAATGMPASGGVFLRHLSAQCDEALAAGRGEPVDEAGLIGEFEVKTHPQGEAVRVWRGVEGSGGINLRLAPAPGDDQARQALQTDMLQSAKQSAGRRREKPAGGIP